MGDKRGDGWFYRTNGKKLNVPKPQPTSSLDKTEELLNSEAVERLLEDVDKLNGTILHDSGTETRVVDPTTGGAKGSKPSQLASAAAHALTVLGEVYGFGAQKYDAHNYRKGYAWSLSISALLRHLLAFMDGEDLDPESGLPHMAHATWHCLTLVQFMRDCPELDDRYKAPTK